MNGTYNIRFKRNFYNRNGEKIKVEFYQKDYEGLADDIKIKSNSVIIYDSNDGDLTENRIINKSCKLTIVNDNSFNFYNELITTDKFKHYLIVKKEVLGVDVYLFEGFVIPDVYYQNVDNNADIEVSASLGLKHLKDIYPEFLYGTALSGGELIQLDDDEMFISFIDLIKECIWRTNIIQPIYVSNTIYNEAYSNVFDLTKSIYDNVYVDKRVFYRNEDKLDCYEVLNRILTTTGSRLWWYNQKFIIQRLKDIETEDEFKVYTIENTESTDTVSVTQNIYNLDDQKIVKDNANISYTAGVSKYQLDLNVLNQENIVHNFFQDIGTKGGYTVEGSMLYPLPVRYNWAFNNPYMIIHNDNYNDKHISNGIHIGYNENTTSSQYDYDYPVSPIVDDPSLFCMTTRLYYDHTPDQSLNVRIKYTAPTLPENVGNWSFRGKFALRLFTPNGDTKWVHLYDSDNDEEYIGEQRILETRISDTPEYYEEIINTEQLFDNGAKLEVNKSIDLTDIINEIKILLNTSDTIYMWLDVFMFERSVHTNQENIEEWDWTTLRTRVGDVRVTTEADLDDNSYELQLDDVNTPKQKDVHLDLYDYSSVNCLNTLYFKAGNNYIRTSRWKEKGLDGKKRLQAIYLADLIQQYNQNRYKIDIDVQFTPFGYVAPKYNDLFDFTSLSNDKFVLTSSKYNVERDVYHLKLQEYVSDDGYYLIEDSDISGVEYFNVEPNSITLSGYEGSREVVIDTNESWQINNINNVDNNWAWFSVSPVAGTGYLVITISIDNWITYDPNYTGSETRIGSFDVVGENETQTVTITQYIANEYIPEE